MSLRDNLNVLGTTQKSTKPFSVPIEKEVTNINKEGNESIATIS